MLAKIKCFIILVLVYLKESNQSHWRGGFITWSPVNNSIDFPVNVTNVSITQKYFYRLDYDYEDGCSTPEDIAAGDHLINKYSYSFLSSQNGPSWDMAVSVYCSNYSIEKDWKTGVRIETQEIITLEPVYALYMDCCWVTDIILPPNADTAIWSFEVTFDLKQRDDTGRINSSPMIDLADSTLYLEANCLSVPNYSYKIQVSDPDEVDLVRCRCRNNECHENFVMNETTCTFYFNPSIIDYNKFYGVYITVEDFSPVNQSEALSAVPLLLLVKFVDNCCKK
jgi:hypothetical protein